MIPVLELDRLGIAHPHITSDVAEVKRISVTSGSLTLSALYRYKLTQVTNIAKLCTYKYILKPVSSSEKELNMQKKDANKIIKIK